MDLEWDPNVVYKPARDSACKAHRIIYILKFMYILRLLSITVLCMNINDSIKRIIPIYISCLEALEYILD